MLFGEQHEGHGKGGRRQCAAGDEGGADDGGGGAPVPAVAREPGNGHAGRRCSAQVNDGEVAIGGDFIAAAVTGVVAGGEVADHPDGSRRVGVGNGLDDMVAFIVRVFVDLVRDLEREQREADAAVVRTGGQPVHGHAAGEQPAGRAVPEADVVPFAGASVHFLLVREVLLAAEQEKGADRSLKVAAAQDRGRDDPPAAGQGHVIGDGPARQAHDPVELSFGTEQGNIDGIPEQAVAGAGASDEVIGHVDAGQDGVEPGQNEVGEHRPEDEREPDLAPAPLEAELKEQIGQPDGGDTTDQEEDPVPCGIQCGTRYARDRDLHRRPGHEQNDTGAGSWFRGRSGPG